MFKPLSSHGQKVSLFKKKKKKKKKEAELKGKGIINIILLNTFMGEKNLYFYIDMFPCISKMSFIPSPQ